MRVVIILFTVVAVALSNNFNLENLDIDKLLSNENQRKAAFACLMDQKPCGEFQGLKDSIPHMVKTKCGDCTPKQKQKYDYVSKVLFEKHPEYFNALALKYSTPAH
ncbi:ejaculatory bulb-specific protein 3-like [Nymphalis io]|uniref:ejaculatory bulb-specific protein 3-like n=1 Tax=Inachis io TaxID=171585 RepID=UPI0021691640|nr:ejaculatory bulb-specific protein 3-like [Nymphalis io]XP_050352530.1 ejaculatory bulb-specific protein 3-like [Nymphalis io]